MLQFSAKLYASSIINFIDKLTYVDYVQELRMFQYVESEDSKIDAELIVTQLNAVVETQLTTDHSILVSAPKHLIELLD